MLNYGKENIMSKSSKKLLITAGCSFTDPKHPGYSNEGITLWPELVANDINADLLNLGKLGTGNDYISNMVTDAVIDNHDRDIVVMVLWSSFNRINLFDYHWFVMPQADEKLKDLSPARYKLSELIKSEIDPSKLPYGFEFDKCFLNYNLRAIWRLNDFLKHRNIEFYQAHSFSIINNILWIAPYSINDELTPEEMKWQKEREQKLIEYTPTNRYFSEDYFTTHSWRENIRFLQDESLQIGNGDIHPNQEGMDWLSDVFLLQIEKKLVKEKFKDNNNQPMSFVYD